MIIFDIQKLPSGLDPITWAEFIKEKILIYDASIEGVDPIITDTNVISLINVDDMTDEDWNSVIQAKNKIDNVKEKTAYEARTLLQKNNQKLIEYLQKLNNH